ncbi:MAG TPA: endolytic transglycosylase MltG [Pseudonocardia sp.]|nr:endolytic transglycosylase MltG [Pseudonocardia sp.]
MAEPDYDTQPLAAIRHDTSWPLTADRDNGPARPYDPNRPANQFRNRGADGGPGPDRGPRPERGPGLERGPGPGADRPRGASEPPARTGGRGPRPPGSPRRRWRGPLLGLVGFAAIVAVGAFLLYRSLFAVPDYDGPGQGDVIVQVQAGDTTSAIATELARENVVRSARAFTAAAAEDESRARSVQPGYYRLRLQMSGEDAVELILDPKSRVGQLEIRGGVQLDDTRGADGSVTPGVLSLISRATCTTLNGASTCLSSDQLGNAMATTPPAQLGVPGWALADVTKADPRRRLEGLIAPGRYDVRPGSSAQEVLRTLVAASVTQYEALGITAAPEQGRYSPYQLLVIASLVEKEGITPDFGKISQVLYNRLSTRTRLELDSTVNYPLDLQALRTSTADRTRPGPYNSYLNYGLPPTPIGAPGQRAIQAMLHPEPGPWLFFVRCQKDGTSCFATTLPQHQDNVRIAMAAGAF